ncbi:D-alanyl-D-alanine carboxypeptidase [Exilibacterium tricleocarpae]|uniref:serine-type D-Ala-D-Ala carboxypeptidase n=1 Tax=Exilibacterium tricleocarpae TaxID=2591008 RepID=A0A545STH0_9GAMM|nr:D-alanyl-D-alanine carboxypeptidase family protein [Exilibacterium tricleocarpae]TQV68260.1 D-alanyl-D-alanine carboxypeptidase [Exilibacterium tricleocarpae]
MGNLAGLKSRLLLLGVGALLSALAEARQTLIPAPPQLTATGYLLVDADTGKVLVEHNADERLPPASLTKIMTSYLVAAEIYGGNMRKDETVRISVKAWRMRGSKMFIREGTDVLVADLLRGMIIQSGNDASVALAEHVAGSEEAFVDVMNQQAALLGMTNTTYKNSTGWPAEDHLTTARDLSLLARALINDYPEHYKIYSERYFAYNDINQPNRNRLLFRDSSVDGMKTGHTEAAGFCLVSSARKNGMRLIAVVMGTRSEEARAAESQKLLTYGFRYYQTHKLYSAGDVLNRSQVWAGTADEVELTVAEDVFLTIPRGAQDTLKAEMFIDDVIKAPLKKGQELGNVTVHLEDELLVDIPLVAQQVIEEGGFFARLWDAVRLFFFKLFN